MVNEEDDSLVREMNEVFAERERVCPEAATGLAIGARATTAAVALGG